MPQAVLFAIVFAFLAVTSPTSAAPPLHVNLYGQKITPQDYLAGYLESTAGGTGIVTIGADHGLLEGQRLMVLSERNERYVRDGWADVIHLRPRTAVIRPVDRTALDPNDIVLVPARRLKLWDGVTPDDEQILRQHRNTRLRNGYDTREWMRDGKEVARQLQEQRRQNLEFWNTQLTRSDQEANDTDYTLPSERIDPDTLPTEVEWVTDEMRDTIADRWRVIPVNPPPLRVIDGEESFWKQIGTDWTLAE